MKTTPVFSLDIANFLIKNKYELVSVDTNKYEEGKVVFFFKGDIRDVIYKYNSITK